MQDITGSIRSIVWTQHWLATDRHTFCSARRQYRTTHRHTTDTTVQTVQMYLTEEVVDNTSQFIHHWNNKHG